MTSGEVSARAVAIGAPAPRARRFFDPTVLIWIALAVLLLFLVANPILRLVADSFRAPGTGQLTLANYAAAFARPRYIQAYINALQLGAAVSVISTALAVPLAW